MDQFFGDGSDTSAGLRDLYNLERLESIHRCVQEHQSAEWEAEGCDGEAKLWADDKEFLARVIIQQLRGKPLLWLSQEENKDVLKDDEDVEKLLEGRYGYARARVA